MANTQARRLTDAELVSMLELARKADSVELKLTVPAADHRTAISSLGLDPLEAQIRQVFFFDTPDLDLDEAGVVVRARRIQNATADTTVKLRPVVPDELPNEVRDDAAFGVEVDAMPGGFVCSGSMKGGTTNDAVRTTTKGGTAIRTLFTKSQKALFAANAPDGFDLDALTVLGPIVVIKLKMRPEGFSGKLALELWNYPDGSRILELSTKCEPARAFEVANEARAFLNARGIDRTGEQSTKTRTALEYFAAQAREAG
jgi:hypothetical protein